MRRRTQVVYITGRRENLRVMPIASIEKQDVPVLLLSTRKNVDKIKAIKRFAGKQHCPPHLH